MTDLPFISIIVPVYNSIDIIAMCIDSLLNQTYPKDKYEIIIVDNNSTDGTAELIKKYPVILLFEREIQTSYAARNTGIKYAKGEIIAFTDADCITDPNWIKNGVNYFRSSDISMGAGRIKFFPEDRELNLYEKYDVDTFLKQDEYVKNGFGATANLFVKRKIFEIAGYFRNDLVSSGDYEFGQRVSKNGELIYLSDAIVKHPARTSFNDLKKKVSRIFAGIGQLAALGMMPLPDKPNTFGFWSFQLRVWNKCRFWDELSIIEKIKYWYLINCIEYIKRFSKLKSYNQHKNSLKKTGKMHIAVVSWIFPAVSETFVINHITGLIDRGHYVKVYAFTEDVQGKIHNKVKKYKLHDKTYYLRFPESKKDRLVKGFKIILKHGFNKPLVIAKCLNIFKYKRNALNLSVLFKVAPFLDEEFDIIHCHFASLSEQFIILKDMFDFKLIATIHGDDRSSLTSQKEEMALYALFKKADLILPMSEFWKNKLIKMGCDPNKIKVHHMGIDVPKYIKTQYLQSNRINILTVARLSEKKGIEYSIRGLAKSINKYPNILYKIIGDGPLNENLKRIVNDLGINGNVSFVGTKNQTEVEIELKSTDIFVLTSITDSFGNQEGIPVSLIEAQGFGLPVVSTYHSGIPELVIDNKSGFLVPEKDIDLLSEKINYLIENPDVCKKIGEYGRQHVDKYFNNAILMDDLENTYKGIIKQSDNI